MCAHFHFDLVINKSSFICMYIFSCSSISVWNGTFFRFSPHILSIVVRVVIVNHLVVCVAVVVALRTALIGHTHTRLPLAHIIVVAHIVSVVYPARWLVVVRLRETVQVVRRLDLEARELAACLPELGGYMPLLAGVARGTFIGTFPVHVQIGRVHRIALHVRPQGVDLVVVRGGRRVAHQVVVHEVGVASGHRVLVERLLGVVYLCALVDHRVRHAHGLPLRILTSIRLA